MSIRSRVIVILAALLALGLFAVLRHQFQAGYAARENEEIRATLQAEQERNRDDARRRHLSDHDLCVEYLGARGLPIDACSSLRGVSAE